MALTPLDISKVEFTKSFRGYSEEEVDDFLDKIVKDYEELYRENLELKEQVEKEIRNADKYKSLEETLKNTLVLAQKAAEDNKLNSEREAENIINEAKNKAQSIILEANTEVKDLQQQYNDLQRQLMLFKTKYRSLLNAQLELLKDDEEGETFA